MEIGEESVRRQFFDLTLNDNLIREDLDLLNEDREITHIHEQALKDRIAKGYDKSVRRRSFQVGDLVMRKAYIGGKNSKYGKLAPNWEGPYRTIEKIRSSAYRLEDLNGKRLPNPWNSDNLRMYYQ